MVIDVKVKAMCASMESRDFFALHYAHTIGPTTAKASGPDIQLDEATDTSTAQLGLWPTQSVGSTLCLYSEK